MHSHYRKLGTHGSEVRGKKYQPQIKYIKTNSLDFLRLLTESV